MRNVCFSPVCSAAATLAAVVSLVVAGCGSDRPPTYPVEGKVVYSDGSPFPCGVIEFESKSEEARSAEGLPLNARGVIQPDGSFRLTTFEANDGAVPGSHRVLVRPIREEYEPEEGELPPPAILDRRFQRYETSELEFTVKEEKNTLTITVERPQPDGK